MFLLLPLAFQAYFRQGVALQYLGRHADALAAFASGLAQDPKSLQLLVGMVEAAMKSPMRGKHQEVCSRVVICCWGGSVSPWVALPPSEKGRTWGFDFSAESAGAEKGA